MKNLFEFTESLLDKFGVEKMIAIVCNLSDEKIKEIKEG